MRIIELEITKFRGIQKLILKPNTKNCVIWGPNGSGKSAVVDAIDFLLTGKVLRLTGKGTEGINLKKHAPHIDCDPKDSKVRAVIQLRGNDSPIEIERCISNPSKLICEPQFEALLQPVFAFAARGQHILTRREILRFITSEAGTRSAEIQDLLNLTEIEEIRRSLVKVRGEYEKAHTAAFKAVQKTQASVCTAIDKSSLNQDDLYEFINANRKILGGQPLDQIKSDSLKENLSPPAALTKNQTNTLSLERDISNIQRAIDLLNPKYVSETDQKLRLLIGLISNDPSLLRSFSLQQLTLLGLKLLNETANCPLCDVNWEPGKLQEYLEEKSSKAKDAEEMQLKIKALSERLENNIVLLLNSLLSLKTFTERSSAGIDHMHLESWISNLKVISASLKNPVNNYPPAEIKNGNLSDLLDFKNWGDVKSKLTDKMHSQVSIISKEQTAWDALTRLSENLRNLERDQDEYETAELLANRSNILLSTFQNARDSILEKLYSDIQNRFVSLYQKIHNHDEEAFNAVFEQTEAKLNISVDFHGRGQHPPHALHSEGHQDTMGLCLYLTLAEHLTDNVMDLIILDDVVMSVDADHRRDICDLFCTEFPDKQFFITTHDRTWASQLKARGVVTSKGCYEFYNWKIQTGPQTNNETDLWTKIEEDLLVNDIAAAAGKLRRGAEEYFSLVCEYLEAKVPYRSNFRWELSDLVQGALAQHKILVKKGKEAANSWNNKERIDYLDKIESVKNQVVRRANIEQWVINDNVHYNSWANYTVSDLQPIKEAFQDLFDLFKCATCESLLIVSSDSKRQIVGVRCNCGEKWSLTGK